MDTKELKCLDIQNRVNKPGSGLRAATEATIGSAGHHCQTNRSIHPHVTSSSSHASTAPVTILHRRRYCIWVGNDSGKSIYIVYTFTMLNFNGIVMCPFDW
ncbi:hypothetical protein PAMA_000178 [Pampus argenteus]